MTGPALIRRLGLPDHPRCVALSADRGWKPEVRSWAFLLQTAQAYGIDAPDGGGLAGSVVLARYGTAQASAGMMLVASRYGHRGLGRALLGHLLDQAGAATVFLTATSAGRPLYDSSGFREVRRAGRFAGQFRRDRHAEPATRSASRQDLPAILAADLAAFGADRGFLLRRLPELAGDIRVLEDRSGITGYGAAWRNGDVTVIGPVVAPDDAGACQLIADLAASAAGPLRLDLDPARPAVPGWLRAHGLARVADSAFMARGPWPPPGRRERLYAPLSVALS